MKPSEYLIQNKIVIGKNPSVIWTLLNKMDKQFYDKEELKEKINNIKNIYKEIEGREITGERYTYYEYISYAKLHQLLNELLEE